MKSKILVVNDDENLRDSLQDNLEMDGYEVVGAGTGRDALKAVAGNFFDVILMDFNLTDTTGIDVIREIRKTNTESQILMMTAHGSLDTAIKAIQESVYDFLIKPVDFDHLKRVIAKSLEKLRLQQENQRLIAELRRANEQLSNLNNMKSKFMSMASHDLSNSLMTLQVSFELLSASIKPDSEQHKRIDYITSGISQLSRLIEDLVDWAAIEKGKFTFDKKPFSLEKMLAQVVVGPQSKAAQHSISLELRVEPGLPMITADQRRIGQVMNNLLENAIRHSSSGGKITVTASKTKEAQVQISVRDTGDGIAPVELTRIFESFYQPQGEKPQAGRGRLGLGLSIAREIVTGHGGKIWVESPGQGKGSAFFFTLPLQNEPGGPQLHPKLKK